MFNQAFSKIWIVVILAVIVGGGILAWQHFGGTTICSDSDDGNKPYVKGTVTGKLGGERDISTHADFCSDKNWNPIGSCGEEGCYQMEYVCRNDGKVAKVGNYCQYGCSDGACESTPEGITEDETANWKIYRNEEYGFEIKYPEDWNYGPNILKTIPNMVFCPPEFSDPDPDLRCKWETVGGHMPNSLAPILLFVDKLKGFSGETSGKGFWEDSTGTYLYRLILSDESFRDIYDQMLSAFRFIEEKETEKEIGEEEIMNAGRSCIGSTKPREESCKGNECKWVVSGDATCSNVNENKNKLAIIITKNGLYNNYKLNQKINSFLISVKNDVNVDNVGINYFKGNTAQGLDNLIEKLYCQKNVGYIILIGDEFEKFMESSNIESQYDNWYYKFSNVGKEYHTHENGYKEPNPDIGCRDVIISWILPPIPYPKQLSDNEKISFVSKIIDKYTEYHQNKNNIISQFSGHLHIQWDWEKLGEKAQFEGIPPYVNKDSTLILNTEHERISKELSEKPAFFSFFVHGWPTALSIGLTPDLQNDSSPVYTTVEEFKRMNYQELTLIAYTGKACNTGWIKWDEEHNICCWPQVFMDAGVWVQFLGLSDDEVRNVIESPFVGQRIRNIDTQNYYMIFGDLTAHFEL